MLHNRLKTASVFLLAISIGIGFLLTIASREGLSVRDGAAAMAGPDVPPPNAPAISHLRMEELAGLFGARLDLSPLLSAQFGVGIHPSAPRVDSLGRSRHSARPMSRKRHSLFCVCVV